MPKSISPERPRTPSSLARLLAVVVALSAAPHETQAQVTPTIGEATSAEPDAFEKDGETDQDTPVSRGLLGWVRSHLSGLRLNFWDRDGKPRFNDLRAWLEPATLELIQPEGEQVVETKILYEIAPHFVETGRVAGENYRAFEQRVQDELHRLWLDEFRAWPGSFFRNDLPLKRELTDFEHATHWSQAYEVAPDQHISKIEITGYASPDHQINNVAAGKTLNEGLAKIRAADAQAILIKYLPYLGIDQLPVAFEVPEFSESDLRDLQGVVQALRVTGKNVHEQILYVINLYSDHRITDPAQKQILDRVIGEKRSVDLKITFDDGRQSMVQVPLPVLALAALYILSRLQRT